MRIMRFCVLLLAAVALPTLSLEPTRASPPKARVENVTDTYHGVEVVDPYRWMENLKAEETQAWIKAQARHADAELGKLPMRDAMRRRLDEVSSASVVVNSIRKRGDRYFYQRRAPDEQEPRLYVREGLDGAERLLVDPAKVTKDGKRYSLAEWNLSPKGDYISYNLAAGGSEQADLRVIAVASGTDIGVLIPRTNFGVGNWTPDGKSFAYAQFPETAADAPGHEKFQKVRAYLYRLGDEGPDHRAIFGYGVDPSIPDGINMLWNVDFQPDWNFALAKLETGVSPEKAFWVTPLTSLDDKARIPWRRIVAFEDQVAQVGIRGDELYALTFRGTPRYRIVRTSLAKPDFAKPEVVFPASKGVVTAFQLKPDAMYVTTLESSTYRIWRVDYETGKRKAIDPPYPGSANMSAMEPGTDGIHYSLTSWTDSTAHFRYDPENDRSIPTKLVPKHPVDMSHVEFKNVEAKSHDGTLVPLVIIHRKGMRLDGDNPTLLNGYGAYGIENTSPFFDTSVLPWIERGGIYVWAGVRGGGEHGEEWHQAGYQKTKPNTWLDFIACAEYLIAQKYTSAKRLGIIGGSAGGVLISNSINERPDLFGAAIINVGVNNTVRAETTANGLPNVPEFGSVATEEGFRALLAMDGYLKVRDGVKYPAVLLSTGINDPRVEPWMSAKMAARLQAATTSGKPVLLRIDYDAGHGIGSTKDQRNAQLADEFAFLFAQLGGAKTAASAEKSRAR